MRQAPPPKQKETCKTPRRFNGALRDIPGEAARLGMTEKTLRAQVARGLIPHRRLGGRIVFLADEVDTYLRQLPGVTAEEALANVAARTGGGSSR